MKKIIFISLALLISLTSCKKNLKEPRKIVGKMLYDCGVPASNAEFYIASIPSLFHKGFQEEFKTDSLGFFEVVFKSDHSAEIKIGPKAGGVIMDDIPFPKVGEVFDVGDVYFGLSYSAVVKLDVTKPYTENDTLFYGDGYTLKWKVGPFQSMIIDTVQHHKFGNFSYDYEYNGYTTQAAFSIKSNGEIVLSGDENQNGVLIIPKASDICNHGALAEEIYRIR